MALGGVAELFFGVQAAGIQLEDIAEPLTAAGAESGGREELTGEDFGDDEGSARRAAQERTTRADRAPPPMRTQRPSSLPTRPRGLPHIA